MDNGTLLPLVTETPNTPAQHQVNKPAVDAQNGNGDNQEFSQALSDEATQKKSPTEKQSTGNDQQNAQGDELGQVADQLEAGLQAQTEQLQGSLLANEAKQQGDNQHSNLVDPNLLIEQSKLASFNLASQTLDGHNRAMHLEQMSASQAPVVKIELVRQAVGQATENMGKQDNADGLLRQAQVNATQHQEGDSEQTSMKDLMAQVKDLKLNQNYENQATSKHQATQVKADIQVNTNNIGLTMPQASTELSLKAADNSLQVKLPVGHTNWANSVFDRVLTLSGQASNTAQIQLNPPNLGPLEVSVRVNNDQASVQFTSHHGAVRDALENSLPRLRDMFANQGINLADVNVSDQSLAQEQAQDNPEGEALMSEVEDELDINALIDDDQILSTVEDGIIRTRLAVDYYA